MKRYLGLILALATAAGAQSTCTTPCTISTPAAAVLPTNVVTYSNGAFSVGGVPITTATFSGNLASGTFTIGPATTYVNGEYDFTSLSGVLTPHMVTQGAVSTPAPSGTDYPVVVAQLAAYGESLIKVPGAIRTAGQSVSLIQQITANPTITSNTFHPSVYVNRIVFSDPTGQVWLYIGNGNGSAYAASSWTVTVK